MTYEWMSCLSSILRTMFDRDDVNDISLIGYLSQSHAIFSSMPRKARHTPLMATKTGAGVQALPRTGSRTRVGVS